MGTINHTPDPAQGALVDAAGVIVLPDDNEDPKGDNIQLGDEQLADWIAFLTKGPANDIDFKITGNGTPPAGGYTPTTNKIIIKGTGLDVSGGAEFTSDNIKASTLKAALTLGTGASLPVSPVRNDDRFVTSPRVNSDSGAVSYGALPFLPDETGLHAVELEPGYTIKKIIVWVDASTGASMPDTKITIGLYKGSATGFVPIEGLEDPETVLANYRNVHAIELTLATPYVVLANERYAIAIAGESGANSETINWLSSLVNRDRTAVDIG